MFSLFPQPMQSSVAVSPLHFFLISYLALIFCAMIATWCYYEGSSILCCLNNQYVVRFLSVMFKSFLQATTLWVWVDIFIASWTILSLIQVRLEREYWTIIFRIRSLIIFISIFSIYYVFCYLDSRIMVGLYMILFYLCSYYCNNDLKNRGTSIF